MTPEELSLIKTLFTVICPISIACNVALLLCVVRYPRFQKPISYLQVCLAVCEIIQCIVYLIGNGIAETNPILCDIVGTVAQFVFTAVTFWTVSISAYCYLAIIYKPKVADSYWFWYHMYSWGLASLMTVALYVIEAIYKRGDVIGDATYECWIGPTYKDLRVNLFYIPLWIHFFLIVGLYTHIFIRVSSVWQIVNEQNIHANIIPAFPSIREEENGHDKSISQDQNHEKESSYVASGIGNQLSVPASATEQYQTQTGKGLQLFSTITRSRLSIKSASSAPKFKGTKFHYKLIARASLLAFGFLVSWIPPSVSRIMSLDPNFKSPYWLSVWVGLCLASSGLWNSSAFFLSWFWSEKLAILEEVK